MVGGGSMSGDGGGGGGWMNAQLRLFAGMKGVHRLQGGCSHQAVGGEPQRRGSSDNQDGLPGG